MRRVIFSMLILCGTASAPVVAQWLNYPTPGIPRLPNGQPDLNAAAPKTADGKPDLTGLWRVNAGFAYGANVVADLSPEDILPWAEQLSRERTLNLGIDDPSAIGCLPRGPRNITGSSLGQLMKVVQTPTLITMLYEELTYRQIHMDGRPLPKEPSPSFMGYSVGRWEADTLVVESVGFNDRTWLDFSGHPHTEALRIIERYRRVNFGRVDLQVTFDDPGAYRRPWTVPVAVTLAPDTELLEFVCNENESRRTSLTGRTSAQQRLSIPEQTLDEYVGNYVVSAGSTRLFKSVQVRRVGADLFLDADGKGNLLLVPISATEFDARVMTLHFERDATGVVARAVNAGTGQVLTKVR
jgi:hypothetical protein